MQPILIHSWPRAIMHVDCDAFFASVEQSIHPELKGKPVITGAERGIVSAASYEAKALGIKRGVSLSEIARICPQCIMLASDYETYSIFSERMFSIVRQYTPLVEEYSIDEVFADLTGLRRYHRSSYLNIAAKLQKEIQEKLDITVSIGISLSKSLSKLCSKLNKPRGLVSIPGRRIHMLLKRTKLDSVWGFGPSSQALLEKHGIKNALDYVNKPKSFAEKILGKIGAEIWMELRGEYIYKINDVKKTSYASISKAKTFTPPSKEKAYVFAQVLRNLESACIKARRYNLSTKKLAIFLRKQNFESKGMEIKLNRATFSPLDLTDVIKGMFNKLFEQGRLYRATTVVLANLVCADEAQYSLFEDSLKIENSRKISNVIDEINSEYGKHTIFLGEGLRLKKQHSGNRGRLAQRKVELLHGENRRQRIGLPMLRSSKC